MVAGKNPLADQVATQDAMLEGLALRSTEVHLLARQLTLLNRLLATVPQVLWVYDPQDKRVLYVSPAFEQVFGLSLAQVQSNASVWHAQVHPEDLPGLRASVRRTIEHGETQEQEYRLYRKGQLRWIRDRCYRTYDEDDNRPLLVGIAEDITENKHLHTELQRLATEDGLTQCQNRNHFLHCARFEIDRAQESGLPLGFLMLDVDDFKAINDQHGHHVGDQALRALAECGRQVLRRGDPFGRVGGEEFAAVLINCPPVQGRQIAERLRDAISTLYVSSLEGSVSITASMGLCWLKPSDSLDKLYQRADQAMYAAKSAGKNCIVET
ncbi:GGDEF domain-containing protein [Atopomonas sediminilitoris]|uniref:GGDEF domain-containing protein n=1 Tax=Atopomonas sediminilitoris TaxID=2919919 RepID=UPI001F4E665B|nr:sensor domain-containing diguanylate cyclase [Atopomonas sediminilitoris]MCJ8169380.1 sensor domain-containing diguanylate cyclase [Atopomonas sediminilitoris]